MKPPMFVPPAQAEALYDAQDYRTQDNLRDDLLPDDRLTCRPWRDDDSLDDALLSAFTAARRQHVKTPSSGPAR